MPDNEGFAQPWLDFESQLGTRLLLRASTPAEADAQYLSMAPLLISKLTFPPPDASVDTHDQTLPSGPKIRIYTPKTYVPGSKPACVFYHGGGWAMGDLEGEDAVCRRIARDSEIVVVSVDYRLAPKHPYPAGLDDCVEAYEWCLSNSEFLKTKEGKIVTCGTSAGANLALSTALRLIDSGKGGSVAGVVAVVPVTVAQEVVPERFRDKYRSYEEHAEHTVNTKMAMEMFFDAYGGDPKDPYVSPMLHTKIKELPRVYMAVCGQDTLRDDGRLMKEVLDENGVSNRYEEYEGYPHWFWVYPSEHLKEPVEKFFSNLKKGFEFVLEK
ncbi:alpha/beta-Hydrolase [Glarea lozoyensis ATCC 20868]|uniref:Alpha/beta-Hydrolase n=1 Tax=Glarea lozoyensis (strain ATCC 20868 / MF5171) TaxID=1116229 RepID=S3DC68_GLAL2|nr:alpha/beta-Hydrolase [Glarea lozoyensis ATCC 20868]EPE24258.1 alpha/beta-Hydrolase [Glarea lozoyensis ATCC 20868]